MVIKDIHIIQIHTFQALVKAGYQVLFRTPITVRPIPHSIAGFAADDHFIANAEGGRRDIHDGPVREIFAVEERLPVFLGGGLARERQEAAASGYEEYAASVEPYTLEEGERREHSSSLAKSDTSPDAATGMPFTSMDFL